MKLLIQMWYKWDATSFYSQNTKTKIRVISLWIALARLWMSLAQSHCSQVWPDCKDNRDTGHEPVAQKSVSLCHWYIGPWQSFYLHSQPIKSSQTLCGTLTSKLDNVKGKRQRRGTQHGVWNPQHKVVFLEMGEIDCVCDEINSVGSLSQVLLYCIVLCCTVSASTVFCIWHVKRPYYE